MREQAGLTQNEARELLGLKGAMTVSRWERDERQPSNAQYREAVALYQRAIDQRRHTAGLAVVPGGNYRDAIPQGPITVRLFQRLLAHLKVRNAAGADQAEIEEIQAQARLAGESIRNAAVNRETGDSLVQAFIDDAIDESGPPAEWREG